MQKSLQFPVIYNGLSNFTDRTVSPSIGLNASAIGGMMEQCYAGGAGSPPSAGDAWIVAENTELRMAAAHKIFFCYGNDTSPAADVLDRRLYVYASFLLSYDPQRSVLWEYYEGTSHFHVMPETQLVALQPERRVASIQDLQTRTGIYERVYRACYLRGAPVGRCAIAVNPDLASHRLSLSGYTRTIALAGGSIVDGGSVRIIAARPPSELDGRSAELAFR